MLSSECSGCNICYSSEKQKKNARKERKEVLFRRERKIVRGVEQLFVSCCATTKQGFVYRPESEVYTLLLSSSTTLATSSSFLVSPIPFAPRQSIRVSSSSLPISWEQRKRKGVKQRDGFPQPLERRSRPFTGPPVVAAVSYLGLRGAPLYRRTPTHLFTVLFTPLPPIYPSPSLLLLLLLHPLSVLLHWFRSGMSRDVTSVSLVFASSFPPAHFPATTCSGHFSSSLSFSRSIFLSLTFLRRFGAQPPFNRSRGSPRPSSSRNLPRLLTRPWSGVFIYQQIFTLSAHDPLTYDPIV